MKRLLFALPLFMLPILLRSQSNFEFGIIAKTGGYTTPKKISDYYFSSNGSTHRRAGVLGAAGVYENVRLNNRFSISIELLLREGYYSIDARRSSGSGISYYREFDKTSLSQFSLSIPLKLYSYWGAKKRFGLYAGAGISRVLHNRISSLTISGTTSGSSIIYTINRSNSVQAAQARNNFTFVSGVNWLLDQNTRIGLDFTLENYDQYFFYPFYGPLIDVYYPYDDLIKMRSFSLSICQNLTKKAKKQGAVN